ncbi:MAG: peptidoglycan DD-metalloendopeptidase family protein [Pseudomonadales bacterium]|nr:peptidoglycan DD-metalloendopeptidase family protein [Pseudomonadales bacterium]
MLKKFPKTHLFAVSAIAVAVTAALTLGNGKDAEANRISVTLPVSSETPLTTQDKEGQDLGTLNTKLPPSLPKLGDAVDSATPNLTDTVSSDANPVQRSETDEQTHAKQVKGIPTLPEKWESFTVQSGDTLSRLFAKAGLSDKHIYSVFADNKSNKDLAQIHPGQTLRFLKNESGELLKIELVQSQLNTFQVYRGDDQKFHSIKLTKTPDVHTAFAQGSIDSSLFLAAKKAGMNESLTMELANIFGWDIDFVLDIREGDTFNVVYEELFLDGKKIGNGKILAAEFMNQGNQFQAVLYRDDKGNGNYYTPAGDSMRKAFLRSPVDFARISSHFNLKRKHPILHKIRAHRGTDYAAGRGTPIRATGDGKVLLAGRKGGYGKTVVIQHGQKFTTLYAHMHRYAKGVRGGSRVKQGQIIGYVGSTGLASGPHLHYEFRVNGVHKNPLTVKFPKSEPIPKSEMQRFKAQTATHLAQLETYSASYQLAANNREQHNNAN